jgi:hypothetical protein
VTKAADHTKELTPKNADMHGMMEEGKPKHGGKEANLSIIGLRKSGNPPPPKAEVDYQGVVALTHTATSVTNVWFFHVLVSKIAYCCKSLMCL